MPSCRRTSTRYELYRLIHIIKQFLYQIYPPFQAMDVSNRCIADRLRLHEEKQVLLQQLRDGMRTVSRLESQLKVRKMMK